jgi:nucleoside-diphosphate-sugar epimerase
MRILLTGKNGHLGFELQRALAPLGEVVAMGSTDCDLVDAQALRALVDRVAPDVIVNPSAYTAVDKVESEPALAAAVNAVAPGIFGEEAAKRGARVVHYSTDYVFDGLKGGAYTETDVPHPQRVYGASKLAGEQALAAATDRHVILRIRRASPTFGQWHGVLLTAENKRQFWIPPGFAHGFVTLSESAEFLYKATDFYAPQNERYIAWNDPFLAIDWQFVGTPSLSAKDLNGLALDQAEVFE